MLSFIIHINIFSVKYSNSASSGAGAREDPRTDAKGRERQIQLFSAKITENRSFCVRSEPCPAAYWVLYYII